MPSRKSKPMPKGVNPIDKPKLGKGPPKMTPEGIKIATPAVEPSRGMQEKIAGVMRELHPGPFRRLKLDEQQAHFAAFLLNEMLRAHPSVHAQMLHPTHGQFDSTAGEAARSFVRSFAARHRIKGVEFDKAYYQ